MSSPGPIVANLELAAFLTAARKTGQFTNDSLERARQAGNDFAASMDRIITQAGESSASIEALSQAILSLGRPRICDPDPAHPTGLRT